MTKYVLILSYPLVSHVDKDLLTLPRLMRTPMILTGVRFTCRLFHFQYGVIGHSSSYKCDCILSMYNCRFKETIAPVML